MATLQTDSLPGLDDFIEKIKSVKLSAAFAIQKTPKLKQQIQSNCDKHVAWLEAAFEKEKQRQIKVKAAREAEIKKLTEKQ
jgi:hypothetical protein